MEDGAANTNKIKAKLNPSSGSFRKLLKLAPWVLFIGTAVALILVLANPKRKLDYWVCSDDVKEWNEVRVDFNTKKDGAEGKYKEFINKILAKSDYDKDPTCLYIHTNYLIDTSDYNKAFFIAKELEKLYESGKVADSRYMNVFGINRLIGEIHYYQALKIEEEQGYPGGLEK